MSKIGIITNPHSKMNRRQPHRRKLLGYIVGEKGRLEVTNSLDDLSRVAKEFRRRSIEILAIHGGDGTINRTITAFINEYGDAPLPKVALLKGGTMNVLANNLGMRGSPEKILFRLVDAHSSDAVINTKSLRSMRVENNYGFLFGNGAISAFLDEFYRNKSGPLGAGLLVLKLVFSNFFNKQFFSKIVSAMDVRLAPLPSAVGVPEHHLSCAVLCATIERMPLGPRLFAKVRGNLNAMQCVSFAMDPKDVVKRFPATVLFHPEGQSHDKLSFTCQELVVATNGYRRFSLDGELFDATSDELAITLGPEIEFVIV